MRASTAVMVAAALVLIAWKGSDSVRKSRTSPFALWQLRPGMRLAEANVMMVREEKRRFTCYTIVAGNRLCTVRVSGIRATLRLLVDDRDRIAVLSFHPDSGSVVLREEHRKVAAEWGLVRPGVSEDLEGAPAGASVTRWTSENGRWTAAMRYGASDDSPVSIRVADERAIERVAESGPLAQLVLEANSLVEADPVEVAAAILRLERGAAADTSDLTPLPARASPAPAMCEPATPDIPEPSGDVREEMGAGDASIIEAAVATTYPGWRLEIGRGFWMTDSSGRSERVSLEPRATSESGAVLAFSVAFPRRLGVASEQRATLDPSEHCRAPADIVIARRTPDGAFRDARRPAFDDDALATDIVLVDVAASDDETAALLGIEYMSAHATDLWSGWVSWTAVLPVEFAGTAPRGVRMPTRYVFELGTGEQEVSGMITVTGKSDEGLELTTLDRHSWGVASRTVIVPLDSAGALRGTAVLGRLH